MKLEKDLYFNKKILIYGLGISGISSFNYLKKNNIISCFDDNLRNLKNKDKILVVVIILRISIFTPLI